MTGSEDLFLGLVRPNCRRLHAVARQYARRAGDAEDLVQEALLRAWRNFEPTAQRVYRAEWLFVILRNVAKEWSRSSSSKLRMTAATDGELTEMALVDTAAPFAQLPGLSEDEFREFLDARLAAAFDGLAAPYREVLVMAVAGGLQYHEIAEVLDCPIGTVMSRMGRARRMLRESIATASMSKSNPLEGRA